MSFDCSHRILVYYFTKNVASERKFCIANSKEKVMASEISLYNDFIDMKARNYYRVNVLKPYLFVLNCLNSDRTSLELKGLLPQFFFFSFKIVVSKLGVGPIYGCGLYIDLYGILVLNEVF